MRQMSHRIRSADLEIEKIRLTIVDRYPVPELMDTRSLTDEQRQLMYHFQVAAEEMGSIRAAMESSRFTKSQMDELTQIFRAMQPMPGPIVPHPLNRKTASGRENKNQGRDG